MIVPGANPRSISSFLVKLLASNTQRRHIATWMRSLRNDYLLSTPSPWMTFDAIEYLHDHIRPGWRIFEYGGGGSTLYWLSLGAECVSVEHDPAWYELLAPRITRNSNVDYRLALPEPLTAAVGTTDASDPAQYLSGDVTGYSFEKYVTQIDSFPDQYFDMVVVDGRSRPACIAHGVSKVKTGGLLVLDNAERNYYLSKTRAMLQGFQTIEYWGALPSSFFFERTDIYVKRGHQ